MTEEKNNTLEGEVVEETKSETEKQESAQEKNFFEKNSGTLSRIFFTLLFGLIGWIAVWIFCFVVIIQFGFLLVTGSTNKNLKAFNKEIGLYLNDMIKYLSFQTDEKPFPFRDWPYDENKNSSNTEQNNTSTVEVSK